MRVKLFSTMIFSAAVLAVVNFAPSRVWAQDSQSDAATAVKVNPSTGIAAIVVASATACVNVACETGDTCKFQTFVGAAQSFTRFGAGLNKATLLACMAINTTNTVSVGSGSSGNSSCSPTTGTILLTSTAKAGGIVTLGFAGQVCTLPTDPHKQVLNAAYVLTASTDTKVASAQGNVTAGYDAGAGGTGLGELSFSGSRD
jgi:hypothetical protein